MPEGPKITRISPEDLIEILNHGAVYDEANDTELPAPPRLEADRTLRTFSLAVGVDPTGRERVYLVEADGTVRGQVVLWETTTPGPIRARGEPIAGEACVSLYGTSVSGNVVAVENEDSGELRVVQMGADEAANIDRLRTDPNRIQWQRPYDGYLLVPSAEIPVAEAALWAPGAGAAILYEVSFAVINNDAGGAAIANVYVGRGVGGGALARPHYWMFNETVSFPANSGWRGPFLMAGNDTVRGSAAVANDASIHFRIRRCDVGA